MRPFWLRTWKKMHWKLSLKKKNGSDLILNPQKSFKFKIHTDFTYLRRFHIDHFFRFQWIRINRVWSTPRAKNTTFFVIKSAKSVAFSDFKLLVRTTNQLRVDFAQCTLPTHDCYLCDFHLFNVATFKFVPHSHRNSIVNCAKCVHDSDLLAWNKFDTHCHS